jgi:large subunit ribosomal protein L21
MYAVIETGGKQYRVEVGTQLEVELVDAQAGDTVTIDRVLLVADGDEATIGRPTVATATVSAEVLRQERGEKVIAFKYRPKARRRVKKGHRQELHVLRIADIVHNGKSAAAAVRKVEAEAKTERQRLEEAARRQAAEDAALAAKLAAARTTGAKPEPTAKPKAGAKPEPTATPKAGTTAKPKAMPETAPAAKAGTKPETTAKPKPETTARSKATPETVPAAKAGARPSAKATPAKPAEEPAETDAAPAPKRPRTKKDE